MKSLVLFLALLLCLGMLNSVCQREKINTPDHCILGIDEVYAQGDLMPDGRKPPTFIFQCLG